MVTTRPNTKTYHGKPCIQCGETLRYKSNGGCVPCHRKPPPPPRACQRCGKEFSPQPCANGRTKYCSRKCNEKARDPEKKRAKDRRYYGRNSERLAADAREYRRATPDWPDKHRWYTLKHKFGLTREDYEAMWEAQNGCCAICGSDDPSPWGWLGVDHCHETGRIRGLLCHGCNAGIGRLKDDPAILRKAIAYLEDA